MRFAFHAAVLPLGCSSASLAHPGHGATPAHVHNGDFAVDVGGLAFVAVTVVGLAWGVWQKRRG